MTLDSNGAAHARPPAEDAAPAAAPDLAKALNGRFMIPAEEAAELRRAHGMSEEQLLQALIAPAAALARPPISNYHVGAVGLGASGNVYVGVNLEFPGLPLNNSVHGEQFLLSNAAWHGETALLRLAVSAAPCGHCRQLYSELACADDLLISFPAHAGSLPQEHTLDQLLPQRFGPVDLLEESSTPLLLQPQNNGMAFGAAAAAALDDGVAELRGAAGPGSPLQWIRSAADEGLRAANEAYAPYTRCPAGAAVIDGRGNVYRGAYLESAAFNPGLPPLQAALAAAVRAGLPSYDKVVAAVVVELPNAPVQFAETAALLLRRIAPHVALTVVPAERRKRG